MTVRELVGDELHEALVEELKQMRATKGRVGWTTLAEYPVALSVAGVDGDPVDSYRWYMDHLRRAELAHSNHYLVACFNSVFGPGKDVLARLSDVGAMFFIDQRTARTWSDRGFTLLATYLIEESKIHGALAIQGVDIAFVKPEETGVPVHLRPRCRISWTYYRGVTATKVLIDIDGQKTSVPVELPQVSDDDYSTFSFVYVFPSLLDRSWSRRIQFFFLGAINPAISVSRIPAYSFSDTQSVICDTTVIRESVTFEFRNAPKVVEAPLDLIEVRAPLPTSEQP